jgi:hypothetical protein
MSKGKTHNQTYIHTLLRGNDRPHRYKTNKRNLATEHKPPTISLSLSLRPSLVSIFSFATSVHTPACPHTKTNDPSPAPPSSTLLSTNAKKATVSVLYWYTSFLSQQDLEFLIQGSSLKKGRNFFFVLYSKKINKLNPRIQKTSTDNSDPG